MGLPSPATGTELYLAAILGELRALRAAVEGGGQGPDPRFAATLPGVVEPEAPADTVAGTTAAPTKRTRARTPRAR